MKNHLEYLYRFRSLDSVYWEKELANLEIYFAKPEELNDQMEDYMNIVWQGDEIAFRSLFKHYLYLLADLYCKTRILKNHNHIDTEHLPVFLSSNVVNEAVFKSIFKQIYFDFFLPESIDTIPKLMAESMKKFNIDEMLLIFQNIHVFAYMTIEINSLKYYLDKEPDKEYIETYDEARYSYDFLKNIRLLINSEYTKEDIIKICNKQNEELNHIETILNKKFINNDTYNMDVLNFNFSKLYFKQIKKILYNNHCVTCFSKTYQNEPMWAHYANNENGICLRFKIQNKNNRLYLNINSICNTLDENGQIIYKKIYYPHELIKVNYSNIYPEIDFFTSLGGLNEIVIKDFWMSNYDKTRHSKCLEKYSDISEWRKQYQEKANEYICTKSKNWSYEEEYRTFLNRLPYPEYEDKDNRMANYNFEDLEAIIFGRKVSMENKRKIKEIIDVHCKNTNRSDFKFYDLYYSTLANELKLKPAIIY